MHVFWIVSSCLLIPPGMWLRIWWRCPVHDMQAKQIQGGLGFSEVQTMFGLCSSKSFSESQLFCYQQCCLWRLFTRVGKKSHMKSAYNVSAVPVQKGLDSENLRVLVLACFATLTWLLSAEENWYESQTLICVSTRYVRVLKLFII